MGGGEIYALKVLATKGNAVHVVLYFFIWPDPSRDQTKGTVLFKVTAPMRDSVEETLAMERDFIQEFFVEAK